MLPEYVTNLNFDQFHRIIVQKKLIIIYPTLSYRNVFLSYFLQSGNDRLLYYRLPYDGITLMDWLEDMRQFLPTTDTPFSHETFRSRQKVLDGSQLGEMFGEYLAALPRVPATLYWDEIDRTSQDTNFRSFMQALAPHIPGHIQIAINARRLDYLPWIEFIDSDICAVLGTNLRKDNLIYTCDKPQKPQLEVYALGQGMALVNGSEMTSWDGALPRQMFYYFIDHHLVTRDEIFQVFWSSLPVKEATNVFHVTKRKIGEQITRLIADGGDYELTQYNAGFYKPSNDLVRHYDVAEFEEAIHEAYTTDDEAHLLASYEKAINLYQGDFLMTIDLPWVLQRREQLRLQFVDALIGVGRVHKQHERYTSAISYYIRALREVPMREDVHRDLMNLYMHLGRREEALVQYQSLTEMLDKNLKVAPSKETRALYDEIVATEGAS